MPTATPTREPKCARHQTADSEVPANRLTLLSRAAKRSKRSDCRQQNFSTSSANQGCGLGTSGLSKEPAQGAMNIYGDVVTDEMAEAGSKVARLALNGT